MMIGALKRKLAKKMKAGEKTDDVRLSPIYHF